MQSFSVGEIYVNIHNTIRIGCSKVKARLHFNLHVYIYMEDDPCGRSMWMIFRCGFGIEVVLHILHIT